MTAEQREQVEILRRIAERGLRVAQNGSLDVSLPVANNVTHARYVDLWQHMLDEIGRLSASRE